MKRSVNLGLVALLIAVFLLGACQAPPAQQLPDPLRVEVTNADAFAPLAGNFEQTDSRSVDRGGLLCANESGPCVQSWNGSDVVMYSDDGDTQTALIDGATGTVNSAGSYLLSDATNEGALFQVSTTITYGLTSTVSVATVPAGADMVDWGTVVTAVFNGSGTDLLNCGTAGDTDRWIDAVDLSSASRLTAGSGATLQSDEWATSFGNLSASTDIQCVYSDQNNNASTGSVTAYFIYRTD